MTEDGGGEFNDYDDDAVKRILVAAVSKAQLTITDDTAVFSVKRLRLHATSHFQRRKEFVGSFAPSVRSTNVLLHLPSATWTSSLTLLEHHNPYSTCCWTPVARYSFLPMPGLRDER